MNEKIQLAGKTAKAKNRLREAGTKLWEIVDTSEEVAFSSKPGPWHYIRPVTSGEDKRDHSRWVNEQDDSDFIVTFIPKE